MTVLIRGESGRGADLLDSICDLGREVRGAALIGRLERWHHGGGWGDGAALIGRPEQRSGRGGWLEEMEEDWIRKG